MVEVDWKVVGWRVVTLTCGAAAGIGAERIMAEVWKRTARHEPPTAEDRDTGWVEALSWAVATGVGVAVARLVAQRSAAAVWEAAADERPPDGALVRAG
jgi:hypothetical protein